MDPWFYFSIFFMLVFFVSVIGVIASFRSDNVYDSTKRVWATTFGFSLLLVIFTIFMASFKVIGTKDIGVPVTFGKTSGHVMHNGWNWKSPTTQVHVFDGALQTEKFSTDKEDEGDPIAVRLFTGSTASVNVTFQWRLESDDNVKQVYLNYRQPDKINTNLVKRALQQSLNDVFGQYNPYASLIAAQAKGNGDTPGLQQVTTTYEDLQAEALAKLRIEMAPQGVSVVSLTIARIDFDSKTQNNLNALGTAITQTQIALQNEKTASAQAESNRLLNSTPASGTTITQLCIQATLKMAEEGHLPGAGWNCIGPSTATVTTSK